MCATEYKPTTPHEFGSSSLHRAEVGQVESQENCEPACCGPELLDRSQSLRFVSRGHVHLRTTRKQRLDEEVGQSCHLTKATFFSGTAAYLDSLLADPRIPARDDHHLARQIWHVGYAPPGLRR